MPYAIKNFLGIAGKEIYLFFNNMSLFKKISCISAFTIITTFRVCASEEAIEKLKAQLAEVIAEENKALAKAEALVAVTEQREIEFIRLEALSTALDNQLAALAAPAKKEMTESEKEELDLTQKREDLIQSAADRIVLLHHEDELHGTAFLCDNEGEVQIFTAASNISGYRNITVTGIDKSDYLYSTELSCPVDADIIGLDPERKDLPYFELASIEDELSIGDQVVVILVDSETNEVKGIGGDIRGIGPDTWELNAELKPEMSGAPVLSLESGKVIGIVAPQVAGVSDDWAIGTRHEGSRKFAARIDKIKEWQSVELDRFTKEASYIQKINDKTRLAWLAHMLVEHNYSHKYKRRFDLDAPQYERDDSLSPEEQKKRRGEYHKKVEEYRQKVQSERESVHRESKKRAAEIQIKRVNAWLKKYSDYRATGGRGNLSKLDNGESMQRNLASIYGVMARELEDNKGDLSKQFTPYHAKQYQLAQTWRKAGIETLTSFQNKLKN